MLRVPRQSASKLAHVTLITPDQALEQAVALAFEMEPQLELHAIRGSIRDCVQKVLGDEDLVALVVEIDPANTEDLAALQQLCQTDGGHLPVIVVTEKLYTQTLRQLLQFRVSDWMRKPLDAQEVVRSCKQAIHAARATSLSQGAKCYAFIGAAGGVGTTILAVESAFLLARRAKQFERTCLIDLDFQSGMIAHYLNVAPNLHIEEIASSPDRLDRQLLDVMLSRHESGLAVLAAPNSLTAFGSTNPVAVTRLLDLASANFDFVVIDLPRSWQPWSRDILSGANKIFIITELTVPGLHHARTLSEVFDESLSAGSEIGFIINKRRKRIFGQYLTSGDASRVLGSKFAGFVAAKDDLVREAIDRGVPLYDLSKSNRIDEDLSRILFTSN